MVTYIVREGVDTTTIFSQENKQLEAYCSGIGKVLLAGLPDAEREDYLATGPFIALTRHTITDPATLRRELQSVAAAGFARDSEEAAEGIHCLALPVRSPMGEIIAALSLSRAGRPPDEGDDLCMLKGVRDELESRVFAMPDRGQKISCAPL
jgi:DNA-binding IclR family transcriptional regulator